MVSHIGFSKQSLLALLEFSYTSTLNLNLDILTEVCAMARYLRRWHALEACSAIKRERETCQLRSRMHSSLGEPNNSMPGPFRKDHSSTSGGKVGLRRRREDEEEGSGSSWNIQAQHREHIVDKVTEESETETSNPHLQCQVPSSYQVEENGFPCSPNRRMKLMDFKSPSCKKKSSSRPTSLIISTSPFTSTRYSSPSGMYFQVRDYVFGCEECQRSQSERSVCSDVGLISRIVQSHSHQVLSKLNSQREAGLFCDITLKTGGGQSFVAHKAVLSAVSEYFQELFIEMDSATDPQSHVDLTGMVHYIFKINQFQNQCLFTLVNFKRPLLKLLSIFRAQEKYRLLSFLGLQRKSLVPGPEELSGWGQKKRLRKLKVSNYSLTARRKPRAQDVPLRFGTSLGVLAAINPTLSLCDMSRMDLLNRPVKVEPWNQERSKRKRHDPAGQTVQPIARATRSRSLLQTDSSANDRPLRRHHRNQDKAPSQPARRGRVPAHNASSPSKSTMLRIKHESSDSAILQPIHRRNTAYNPQGTSPKAPGRRGRPPADRTVRVATTKLQHTKRHKPGRPPLDKPKSSKQIESKTQCNHATGMPQANHSRTESGTPVKENRKIKERGNRKDSPEVQYAIVNWDTSNHQQLHSHPLYKTIKEEPAEPLPLTQPFPPSDSLDLGKRQSKPPIKLLDQGFLFGFCRPPSGIKREEESVDIYLTRSVSHGSSSNCDSSPGMVRRDRVRARILPDRTGLNGPHWAGLGNRHSPFSQRTAIRVKTERDETGVSQVSKVCRVSRHPQVSKRSCKIKKEPTKTKNVNKLLPLSSRHSVLLETIRRTRLKQQKGPRGQASSGAHACLQCRGSYRDCDALIMHRIRHIEGKHWPCPLCSKTFFRQRNVRNHIRTHNPKIYKCRQCIAAQ
ncbi:uncharacterized protein [Sinocyclocheilus grahami]|uniref:uncharacterized protein n=1 Tax=Sinocyclocheilus grahami TaxID=75366 RepID=UPI0007AD2FF3|nr:PREDICTED: uncharacterized protein LOC107600402 [Sinocyclocheilus grahami]